MSVNARRGVARVLLGAGVLVATSVSVFAQSSGSPAVFGGARELQPGANNLSMSADAIGGYDTNILADNAGVGGGAGGAGSTEQTSSSFAGGSVYLQWNKSRRRVSYFGTVGTSYRKFFDIEDFDAQSYDAGGGMNIQFTTRSSLGVNANVGVQPFYQFGVLGAFGGGLAVDPTQGRTFRPDYQAAREQVLRFAAAATYRYQLSSRTEFSADVGRTGFQPLNSDAEEAGYQNLGATTVAARLSRRLSRNLSARAGYGYTLYDQVDQTPNLSGEFGREQFGVHNIDVGLDYSRALGVARRTSLSFGTGSSITTSRNEAVVEGPRNRTQFNVSGFATLRRNFLRTWAASLDYARGTSYVEGYNSFVVFDTASARIGGLFTDRLDASAGIFYTYGAYQSLTGDTIASLGAGGQVRYALTQNLAAFAAYTYSRSDIPRALEPQDLVGTYRPERQGVRAGLTVWFDLLR